MADKSAFIPIEVVNFDENPELDDILFGEKPTQNNTSTPNSSEVAPAPAPPTDPQPLAEMQNVGSSDVLVSPVYPTPEQCEEVVPLVAPEHAAPEDPAPEDPAPEDPTPVDIPPATTPVPGDASTPVPAPMPAAVAPEPAKKKFEYKKPATYQKTFAK